MRQGTNPAKHTNETLSPPRRVAICLLTYIPFIGGYWKEALPVLKLCIDSILANTDEPVDIFVFDNGSDKDTIEYLQNLVKEKKIQFLILSDRNVGKNAAWNMLIGAVQSEYIVYADSDVYFYPGWLKSHLEIFDTFKHVGMVSGLSVRERAELFTHSTIEYAKSDPSVTYKRGKFVNQEYLDDFRKSLGKDPIDYQTGIFKDMEDIQLEKDGVTAYAGANHFQFMSRTDILRNFIPFPSDKPLGAEKVLDEKMDNNKFLRLSTEKRFVHHIGNNLEGDSWYHKISGSIKIKKEGRKRIIKRIVSIPAIRKLLVKFYDILSSE